MPIGSLQSLAPQERIASLSDAGSVAQVNGELAAPRPSPHLARWKIAARNDDGIVVARARIAGLPVLVAAQDERFLGGSVGAGHGEALRALFDCATRERPAAVVLLLASGGVRLHEANPAEWALARALSALQDARVAAIPVLAIGVGDVFGGASVLACAADRLALLPGTRLGLSGPRVIETTRGRAELDAANEGAVTSLFGAAARTAAGQVELLAADADAVRSWIAFSAQEPATFAARVAATQSLLAARLAAADAAIGGPDSMAGAASDTPPFAGAKPVDRHGWLWRDSSGWITVARALGTTPFGPREAHTLDSALLTEYAPPISRGARTLIIVEDSPGHEASRSAEALCVSQYLAQHTAVLAHLRSCGVKVQGLLAGTGHSAAFFANALQAQSLHALATARVIAMDPAAIARVTGLAPLELAALIDDDPLLGQPVRCFAQWGGIAAMVPGIEALTARCNAA